MVKCVTENAEVQAKVADLKLPAGFELVIEPWPFGAPDPRDGDDRLFQALMFAQRSGNPDSNFYAYPLPIIPVVNIHNLEVVRIETPATGGAGDSLTERSNYAGIVDHCTDSEYVPELLPGGTRQDLKPLTVVQPYGPSFKIDDGNLIRWQKWQFRVSFNPREGAVLHDLRYDGRSVLYRLSISDMVSLEKRECGWSWIIQANRIDRLSPMPTRETLTTESRPLTLATEVSATL